MWQKSREGHKFQNAMTMSDKRSSNILRMRTDYVITLALNFIPSESMWTCQMLKSSHYTYMCLHCRFTSQMTRPHSWHLRSLDDVSVTSEGENSRGGVGGGGGALRLMPRDPSRPARGAWGSAVSTPTGHRGLGRSPRSQRFRV